jgi:3-keto-disaccharide hydrolase
MRTFLLTATTLLAALPLAAAADEPTALFTENGPPKGWVVRAWNDVTKPAGPNTEWTVKDGVLRPGKTRGTWILSEKEYGDFILEFEIKLTEVGNSGIALRAPMKGDPAFDGMELQFADFRYNKAAKENELTGSIYRASAPTKQVYKPTEWNTVKIELKGSKLKATINGELVQDIDLDKFDKPTLRLDNKTEAPPLKDRPRKGHIGFQHLSRNNEPIEIRKVKVTELK